MLEILVDVSTGKLSPEIAQSDILDLLGISKKMILRGGDELWEYRKDCIEDCERLKNILISKGFVNAGLCDAAGLWGEYSDGLAAGWLGMPEDDEILFKCVEPHINVIHSAINL